VACGNASQFVSVVKERGRQRLGLSVLFPPWHRTVVRFRGKTKRHRKKLRLAFPVPLKVE